MDDANPKHARRTATEPAQADVALAAIGAGPSAASGHAKPSALIFQYRVLKALVLRDMASRYGESRLGYLTGILLPIISLAVIMLAFRLRGRIIPTDFSLGAFVVTGYPLWTAFQGMSSKVVATASRTDPLLMFPQITQLDLVFATIILEFSTNTVVFIILAVGVTVLFQDPLPADPVGVTMCFWACNWIGAAFGLVLCAINRLAPMVVSVLNTFMRFGMWISGVIFSVNKLPQWTWPYLQWNPILHCTEGARHLWRANFDAPIFNPIYIVSAGFVLTTVGFVLERLTRRFVGP